MINLICFVLTFSFILNTYWNNLKYRLINSEDFAENYFRLILLFIQTRQELRIENVSIGPEVEVLYHLQPTDHLPLFILTADQLLDKIHMYENSRKMLSSKWKNLKAFPKGKKILGFKVFIWVWDIGQIKRRK